MRTLPLLLVMLATPAIAAPSMPWLANLDDAVIASSDEPASTLPLELDPVAGCEPPAYGGITLTADLGPPNGRETVVGSYAGGIIVVGSEGQRIATLSGYPCAGTADELEAMAVGRAWNERVLALVVTSGGRREASTWLGLYRLGATGLELLFSGAVEHYEDGVVRTGLVTIVPGGLIHRDPNGDITWWGFEHGSRALQPHRLSPMLPGA
ncbi:MAG: hypothetical protein AB7T06_01155 [Kofleriaceae bacterium]